MKHPTMKRQTSITIIILLLLGFLFSSQNVFVQESQAVTRESIKSALNRVTEEQITQIQELVIIALRRSKLDGETAERIIYRGNQLLKRRNSKMLNKLSELSLRRLVKLLEMQVEEFMDFVEEYCYTFTERHWFVLQVDYKTPLEELIPLNFADSIIVANFSNPKPGPSRAGYILVEFENRPVTCEEAMGVLKTEYILANIRELIAFTKCGLVSPYPVVGLGSLWHSGQYEYVPVLYSSCSSGKSRHSFRLVNISRKLEQSAYFLVRYKPEKGIPKKGE